MKRRFWVLLLLAGNAFAQEEKLISGPGSTLTENKCKICHELQHIRRAQLSPGEWADNLRNMKERGTPMTDAEMAVIHKYLSTYYNRDKPAPAAGPDTLVENTSLVEKHGCAGCHALDTKVVGPAFRDIARKYDASAKPALVRKVREGGQGAWGNIPMPPNPVAEADASQLVDWILSQK